MTSDDYARLIKKTTDGIAHQSHVMTRGKLGVTTVLTTARVLYQ
jgi:hypothetical protein